jgi:anthranilate synthase component 2
MLLLIDNYDSFTYNLYQYLAELGARPHVVRNDETDVEAIIEMAPEQIVISPGPCTPREAGISVEVVRRLAGDVPILGVCLGHQCIGEAFGGVIERAGEIVHGKMSAIHHDGKAVYRDLPNPFPATRYHSLVVRRDSVPSCLEVSAWTDNGLVMGVRHRELPLEGVQFHPESVLTDVGKDLLRNFLEGRA